MSEGLEKLRSIGAQKIHEQTHISHKYVQAILHESFDGMQKVQLLGFISILEREYEVDLSALKERAIEHFEEPQMLLEEEPQYKKELLVSSMPNRKRVYIIALVLFVIVAGVLYLIVTDKNPSAEKSKNTETTTAYDTRKNLSEKSKASKNKIVSTKDQNKNVEQSSIEGKTLKPLAVQKHTLSIFPRTKVWLGIIDLDTGKKRQTVTSQSIELNASKNYLLSFGHGYIDIDLDGNTTSFKDPKNIKFLYKNGELTQIGNEEFKRHNKGRLW